MTKTKKTKNPPEPSIEEFREKERRKRIDSMVEEIRQLLYRAKGGCLDVDYGDANIPLEARAWGGQLVRRPVTLTLHLNWWKE